MGFGVLSKMIASETALAKLVVNVVQHFCLHFDHYNCGQQKSMHAHSSDKDPADLLLNVAQCCMEQPLLLHYKRKYIGWMP